MKQIELSSAQTAEVLFGRLEEKTTVQPKFRYLRWINRAAGKPFYGALHDGKFTLSPCAEGRNFFTPVIHGEILEERGGSVLRYGVTWSPDMKRLLLFFGVLLCINLACLFDVRSGGAILYGSKLLFALFPAGLCGIAAVFLLLNHYQIERFKKSVFETFSALANARLTTDGGAK